uniref:Uncharacterized protein n=1 Tax=Triticum urartu TaxID=4572 RepID=A0A8R7UWP8_TRIUA
MDFLHHTPNATAFRTSINRELHRHRVFLFLVGRAPSGGEGLEHLLLWRTDGAVVVGLLQNTSTVVTSHTTTPLSSSSSSPLVVDSKCMAEAAMQPEAS